jgi:TolB-like protein/DNA-binding winged helix-turn-helix (wHTH) protein/Flp pilus assembly protein TadD
VTNLSGRNLSEPNAASYIFGDFMVDCAKFTLVQNGQLKSLQPRAYDLLVYLIENRDRVVEKQELFERVWNESFVTDNALTRAIKEIRNELADDAGSPRFIQTIHKRGYRFIGELREPVHRNERSELRSTQVDYEAQPDGSDTNSPRKYQLIFGSAVLLLLVSTTAYFYFDRDSSQIRSLVVLPLDNSTGSPEADYMCDGITEGLINSLSRLSKLKVIPRTTAFRYKRKEIDAQQLGRELGADAVVTGRVTQQGDNIHIQTELTSTADGSQFWGHRFSRRFSDVFLLQEEIATAISEKLRLRLSGEEEKLLTTRYTNNARAYELFLHGRYRLAKLTPPEVNASVNYFQQAIDADPTYALAYVGLADAYSALALSVDMPATEFYPKAKAAAQKALEIDESLADAHTSLGFVMQFYDWDFKAAENQYLRALELNPNSPNAHFAYSSLLSIVRKFDDALNEIRQARELDPLDLRITTLEGRFLSLSGREDEGLVKLQKVVELEPHYFLAHLFIANVQAEKGRYTEALAAATRARDLSDGNAEAVALMGYSMARSGDGAGARAVLVELRRRAVERYVPPYDFAIIYNGLGERDETFVWLERGFEERDPKMLFLNVRPQWNNLRDDPRFTSLLERMAIPIGRAEQF